ncbi:hypothetical protein DYH09_08235 [bacterium CPR1]|nr:hypothetical protein [bacterium CPR1]
MRRCNPNALALLVAVVACAVFGARSRVDERILLDGVGLGMTREQAERSSFSHVPLLSYHQNSVYNISFGQELRRGKDCLARSGMTAAEAEESLVRAGWKSIGVASTRSSHSLAGSIKRAHYLGPLRERLELETGIPFSGSVRERLVLSLSLASP